MRPCAARSSAAIPQSVTSLHEHVEGGLVELDDIDAVFLQCAGFLVQQLGERESHLHLVAVVAVGDGVGDGHGAGQGEFQFPPGVGARQLRFHRVHPPLEADWRHHLRHHRFVAVGADAHLHLVGEVDALDAFQEAVHEVLARLLAVADDVDARILLLLDGEQGGIALGRLERRAFEPPGRPQPVGLGEPGRLRQAAGNGGLEHGALLGLAGPCLRC